MAMTNHDRIVWAAMFARTNMGQPMPTADDIRRYRVAAKPDARGFGASLAAMVNMVCADYIENDDHYNMFLDEARSWFANLNGAEFNYIFETWPDKRAVWEASEVAA